tara:strand:- start:507 stop:896 length:390 start_codon:yes stop_codon:yes gene_type:complete
MLVAKKFNDIPSLLTLLRGTPIASGSVGTNTGAAAVLSSALAVFTDVAADDIVHIAGEAASFVVGSVAGDFLSITLTTTITNAHTANANWRVFRGAIASADIKHGPMPDPTQSAGSSGLLIYEELDFKV